jgi:hypothetical protein
MVFVVQYFHCNISSLLSRCKLIDWLDLSILQLVDLCVSRYNICVFKLCCRAGLLTLGPLPVWWMSMSVAAVHALLVQLIHLSNALMFQGHSTVDSVLKVI